MARNIRRVFAAMLAFAGAAGATLVACGGDSQPGGGADGGSQDATTATMADASGGGDETSANRDGGSDGATAGDGEPAPNGPCVVDEDCVLGQTCLFATGAACGVAGTCTTLPEDGPGCAEAGLLDPTQETSCSCDGTPRHQPCTLPAGYTRGNIVHPGPCADGGQVCHPAAPDCPDRQICAFRVADGCSVTTAHCFDGPDPTLPIPGVLVRFCGCDGGSTSTFPDTDLYVMAPARGNAQVCADEGTDTD